MARASAVAETSYRTDSSSISSSGLKKMNSGPRHDTPYSDTHSKYGQNARRGCFLCTLSIRALSYVQHLPSLDLTHRIAILHQI